MLRAHNVTLRVRFWNFCSNGGWWAVCHKRVVFENLRPCHLGRVADPVYYWTCPDPVSEKLPEFVILDLGHISVFLIL